VRESTASTQRAHCETRFRGEHSSLLIIRTVDDFVWLLATDYRLTAQRVAYGTPVPQVRPAGPPRVAEVYGVPFYVRTIAHPRYRLGTEAIVAEDGVLGVTHRSAAVAGVVRVAVGLYLVVLDGLRAVHAACDDREYS